MDRDHQGNYQDPRSLLGHNRLTDEQAAKMLPQGMTGTASNPIRDEEEGSNNASPMINELRRNIPRGGQLPAIQGNSRDNSLPPLEKSPSSSGLKKVPVRARRNGDGAYLVAKPNYKLDSDLSAGQKTPLSVAKDIDPAVKAENLEINERTGVRGKQVQRPQGDLLQSPSDTFQPKLSVRESDPSALPLMEKRKSSGHRQLPSLKVSPEKEDEVARLTNRESTPVKGLTRGQMSFGDSPDGKDGQAGNSDHLDRDKVIQAELNKILNKKEDDDSTQFVVKMDNIQKAYLIGIEAVAAVRGIDLTVKRGEFLCILGTSGGGKSTLLNCMGTIDTPSRGNLKLFGEYMRSSTSDSHYAKIRLNKIGFVFQSFNLIGTMTAMENVELPMLLKGELSREQVRDRARKLLHDVNLQHRMHHYPNMLSGGEQQRVTIARALSNEPELLLMDEPTGDLDTKNSDIIIKILMDLNREGITMVMVTHDENMKKFAHRVVHIMDGKLAAEQVISTGERTRAIADLEDVVASYGDPEENELGVRGGINKNEQTQKKGLTEERKLENYDYFKFLMKRKQEKEKAAHQTHHVKTF